MASTPTFLSTDNERSQLELDRFIKIEQAARVLDVSKSWLYQNRETLPFIVQLPDGPLRVSVRKLRDWMDAANGNAGSHGS